ncbi:MAG: hypothetical protein R2710_09435 [Acidimicrobiales bacterium]
MTTVVASISNRETGTGPSRRIRVEGGIPGVVYGLGQEPVAVSVGYAELRDALKGPRRPELRCSTSTSMAPPRRSSSRTCSATR